MFLVAYHTDNLIINVQSKYLWFSKCFNCYCSINFSFSLSFSLSVKRSLLCLCFSVEILHLQIHLFHCQLKYCPSLNHLIQCTHIFSSLFFYYYFGFCLCHILFHHFHVLLVVLKIIIYRICVVYRGYTFSHRRR